MLIFVFAVCFILGGGYTYSIEEHLLRDQWEGFKTEHNKAYETAVEDEYRFSIFTKNLHTILDHNKQYHMGLSTYTMSMNQFADLTNEEYQYFYQMPYRSVLEESYVPGSHHEHASKPLPKKIDWRIVGAVTEVKSQEQCGACYAFSALGALESHYYIATNKLIALSEQNILDCTKKYKNKGCLGGRVDASFQYIIDNNGVDTQSSYPYIAARHKVCLFNKTNVGATMRSFVRIKSGNETALQVAVAWTGPVSVMVDGQQMQFYSGGVYDNPKCSSTHYSHGMTVVGYGTYKNIDYWLVKNSHGINWGERGYIMMRRNKGNQCAIAVNAMYPVV